MLKVSKSFKLGLKLNLQKKNKNKNALDGIMESLNC